MNPISNIIIADLFLFSQRSRLEIIAYKIKGIRSKVDSNL